MHIVSKGEPEYFLCEGRHGGADVPAAIRLVMQTPSGGNTFAETWLCLHCAAEVELVLSRYGVVFEGTRRAEQGKTID